MEPIADLRTSRRVTLCEHSIDSTETLKSNKIALVIDAVGAAIKSDDTFTTVCYPSGTIKMIEGLLQEGKLRLNTEFVIFHLGSNIVMEFERSDLIGKVIKLSKTTRDKYPDIKIYFSSLIPRPPDHTLTDRAVIRYNDALKTAVNVANRRYAPIKYISNHQLFVNPDSSYKADMFHKKEIKMSKKGIKVFQDNLLHVIRV